MYSVTDNNFNFNRYEFDEYLVPVFYEHLKYLQDVHSVASALKMYFHEVSNPLCTDQFYHAFVYAVQCSQEVGSTLLHMKHAVQKLPSSHCRYCRIVIV
jgi:purine-nucleoside phosphorylase